MQVNAPTCGEILAFADVDDRHLFEGSDRTAAKAIESAPLRPRPNVNIKLRGAGATGGCGAAPWCGRCFRAGTARGCLRTRAAIAG